MTEPVIPPLVTIGHPLLARPSARVKVKDIKTPAFRDSLQLLIHSMVEYMGIGIAAPQLGWFQRFFVMMVDTPLPDNQIGAALSVWVNPEIVDVSEETNWAWEGCLSVPNLRGWIRRPSAVAVRGYNEVGKRVGMEFTGWSARVFQHEYDHLDGVLFPYRVEDPRHLVTVEQMSRRQEWPDNWPAPGARTALLGQVLPDTAIQATHIPPYTRAYMEALRENAAGVNAPEFKGASSDSAPSKAKPATKSKASETTKKKPKAVLKKAVLKKAVPKKAVAKKTAKKADKPAVKTTPKASAKDSAKKTAIPTPKTTEKKAAKLAVKSSAKTPAKTVSKTAAKPTPKSSGKKK